MILEENKRRGKVIVAAVRVKRWVIFVINIFHMYMRHILLYYSHFVVFCEINKLRKIHHRGYEVCTFYIQQEWTENVWNEKVFKYNFGFHFNFSSSTIKRHIKSLQCWEAPLNETRMNWEGRHKKIFSDWAAWHRSKKYENMVMKAIIEIYSLWISMAIWWGKKPSCRRPERVRWWEN